MGASARAQDTARTLPQAPASPQLTLGARPSSSIAASLRPQISASRASSGRSLLIAFPADFQAAVSATVSGDVALAPVVSASVVSAKEKTPPSPGAGASGVVLSGKPAPQTLISPPKRVKVTSKTRFAASRVSPRQEWAAAPSVAPGAASNGASNGLSNAAPMPEAIPPLRPAAPAAMSPRDRMAHLPSRGGPMRGRAPVELRPAAPETVPMSDSQRLLLAQLDADLGRAQRRLNRAETRLSEGQRQLGAFTGVLRTAMFDTGDDGRGLHPFVRVAQRYMGTPYVWGGESAQGFDCSGFIMRVMRDLGYRALPHSAAEQFNYGMPVARELLKPGDIVFFANTYKPGVSHVGIYLGKGRFIHAANSSVGTIVSGLNEPKWVQHYAGARRLIRVKS